MPRRSSPGRPSRRLYEFFDREFRLRRRVEAGPHLLRRQSWRRALTGAPPFSTRSQPDLERQNLWNLEDKNGLLIVQELIANAGKNFASLRQ